MANNVINLDEYRAANQPALTAEQARAEAASQGAASELWWQVKQQAAQLPTWAWVAGGIVVVGIFAARWSRK